MYERRRVSAIAYSAKAVDGAPSRVCNGAPERSAGWVVKSRPREAIGWMEAAGRLSTNMTDED